MPACAVLGWLDDHPGWLLIVNNVDTPEAATALQTLLARLRSGHVLITSRIANWPAGVEPLELHVLDESDAVAFLMERARQRRRTHDEDAHVRTVVRALDGLALALEQAGAFIETRRLSFAEYRKLWESKRAEVLRWHDERLMGYPASVAVTWETSFARLDTTAQSLLRILSWLAPEPIPLALFETEPLIEAIAEPREALSNLASYSLSRFAQDNDTVTIHRLVQEIARSRATEPDRLDSLRVALKAVNDLVPHDADDVRTWPALTPVVPHAESAGRRGDEHGITDPTARLANQLGLYFGSRGQFPSAEPLFRRALAIAEATYGPDHPHVARALNNLAGWCYDTNRRSEAEPLFRRALAIDEASYGPDHPLVARALNNLAELLRATNRPSEAEPLYRRALAIAEVSYGPDHPQVAKHLNNLAGLLHATNRRSEAEPLFRRALAIDEESYGPDHPDVATDLNNLASLLEAKNRRSEAEPLCRRALAIDEGADGPDHPAVAGDLNNLAGLLRDTNRLLEAEPLFRRTLAILVQFQCQTRHEHPEFRVVFDNYSVLLKELGRTPEQIEIAIREAIGSELADEP